MKFKVNDHVRISGREVSQQVFQGHIVHVFPAFEAPNKRLLEKYYNGNPPMASYKPSTMDRIVVDCGQSSYFVTPVNRSGSNEIFEITKLYDRPSVTK